MSELPILSIMLSIPLSSALFILCFAKQTTLYSQYPKYFAILSSILTMMCSIYLLGHFDKTAENFHFEERYEWLSYPNIYYHIGVDGISLFLIMLTSLLCLLCIISSLYNVKKRINEFLVCFLLLEFFLIGSFCARDILLFYIFFEATLIPMYLIIGIWGGENRVYASIKFFLYTLLGSVFFLIAIIYIYQKAGTFEISKLYNIGPSFTLPVQKYLWLAMFASFAVKVPMVPFHTWLPHAHVQAPASGSVILAGVLLKLGGYGFLRFSLPILPDASVFFAPFVIILSIIAIIYSSLVALAQDDIKKVIAYSSVAHMGYVTASLFSLNKTAISGAYFQMLSHGIISSALFFVIGALYERIHTRNINNFGGFAERMPILATFFMIFTMASVGLPSSSGFIGEFYSIIGVMQNNYLYGSLMVLGVLLGPIYMLILYKSIMLGKNVNKVGDIEFREIVIFLPLAILTIGFGIFPNSIMELYDLSITKIADIFQVMD